MNAADREAKDNEERQGTPFRSEACGFAVLVLSCDRYRDLWAPFLAQFNRYFPPGFRIYVGSNREPCMLPGVVPILSGDDVDWSTSLLRILAQIPERKLFVILEDLLLAAPVDRARFDAAVHWLFERDAVHIKYWASPKPEPVEGNSVIGQYPAGMPYRATVCGFWDRAALMDLLIPGENPWNFEILGSYRASYTDAYYGLLEPLCEYRNMIEKGKWIAESVEWARRESVPIDELRRPLLRRAEWLASRAKMRYFHGMARVPWRLRVALMNHLRRLLISY